MPMTRLVIKPITDVVSEEAIKRKTEEYVAEMLRNAKNIGNGLYIIDRPAVRPTPSFHVDTCPVKSLIRLRLGTVTTMSGIRAMARGKAIHDMYQEWFRIANPNIHVEVESGIETVDTSGRADIIYMREFDGEEVWGLIELKSTWNLTEEKVEAYTRQVASYILMLEEAGINIREAYLVTMREVKPLPVGLLRRDYASVISDLRALWEFAGLPTTPPKQDLCESCELKPICIPYQIAQSTLGSAQGFGASNRRV
mgnify:CR=1 FL=1